MRIQFIVGSLWFDKIHQEGITINKTWNLHLNSARQIISSKEIYFSPLSSTGGGGGGAERKTRQVIVTLC
jgi:hypothetical protein